MTENPIELFSRWFEEAKNCKEINDATEFCLATASKVGKPSARIVLLKKYDDNGFCFFTNYTGRKSKELIENPYAALCFYWDKIGKQVRIEGSVEKLSAKESDEYFKTRSLDSKLGAWASKQSSELHSREEFFNELDIVKKKFADTEITRPDFWGGWRVAPNIIEFWEAEQHRYHKRRVFEKNHAKNWANKLLYP